MLHVFLDTSALHNATHFSNTYEEVPKSSTCRIPAVYTGMWAGWAMQYLPHLQRMPHLAPAQVTARAAAQCIQKLQLFLTSQIPTLL
jgi:hypothetical protein